MKCFIIDDEELARDLLRVYCDKIPTLEVVGEFSNATEAKKALRGQEVDLLLLDIQMPEMTGIEFISELYKPPMTIFTTAYSEFAIEGFELDVTDYLLKPFSFERFQKAIDKTQDWFEFSEGTTNKAIVADNKKDYIVVKSEHKVYRITYKEINYIQSLREYVAFHTASGKTMSLGSLKQLEKELPESRFMRVHKSYIIAKDKVNVLEGNIIHLENEQIPIGPSYKERVVKELF